MARIIIEKINDDNSRDFVEFQDIRDNKEQIINLLCELNLIDEFDESKKEKITDLALALHSHAGPLDIE